MWRSQARRSRVQRVATRKDVAIASAAKPGAAGRYEKGCGDRKRGEAGCSGSLRERMWRSQARRSRVQRVATRKDVAIASAAKPGAAGRYEKGRGDRKRGEAGCSGSPRERN